jgi:hypothetical protein
MNKQFTTELSLTPIATETIKHYTTHGKTVTLAIPESCKGRTEHRTKFEIHVFSNEHPRTINTPMMGRVYWSAFYFNNTKQLKRALIDLVNSGYIISKVIDNQVNIPQYEWERWLNEDVYVLHLDNGATMVANTKAVFIDCIKANRNKIIDSIHNGARVGWYWFI